MDPMLKLMAILIFFAVVVAGGSFIYYSLTKSHRAPGNDDFDTFV